MRAVVLTCLYTFPRLRFSASARLPFLFIQSAGSLDDVVGSHFLWSSSRFSVWPWPRISDVTTYCGNPASDEVGCTRTASGAFDTNGLRWKQVSDSALVRTNILNVLASFDSGVSCWYPHEQVSPSWWFSSIPCCRWVLFWNIKLAGPFQTTTRALAVLTNILRPRDTQ
jgi:hypothetical protein